VRIRFPGFVATEVSDALEMICQRKRLPQPLTVDLEFEDSRRLTDCEIAGFWGGELGKRWFESPSTWTRLRPAVTNQA
jgi:hypothetical protein